MDDLKSIYDGSATSEERVSFFKKLKTDATYRKKYREYREKQEELEKEKIKEFKKRFNKNKIGSNNYKIKVFAIISIFSAVLFLSIIYLHFSEGLENHAPPMTMETTMGGNSSSQTQQEKGYKLIENKDYQKAIKILEKIPLDEEEPDDYYEIKYRIAYAYAHLNDNETAIKILKNILSKNDLSYELREDSEAFKSYLSKR